MNDRDLIEQQAAQIAEKDAEIARLNAAWDHAFRRAVENGGLANNYKAELSALRADAERLTALATCGCGDVFTAHDPGTCGNCMAAIDAALRQEQPT